MSNFLNNIHQRKQAHLVEVTDSFLSKKIQDQLNDMAQFYNEANEAFSRGQITIEAWNCFIRNSAYLRRQLIDYHNEISGMRPPFSEALKIILPLSDLTDIRRAATYYRDISKAGVILEDAFC